MVYVDTAQHRYGRMKMCHMLADTTEELVGMAEKIGVQQKWIQHAGTPKEHFDICLSKKALAIKAGAKEVEKDVVHAVIQRKTTKAMEGIHS